MNKMEVLQIKLKETARNQLQLLSYTPPSHCTYCAHCTGCAYCDYCDYCDYCTDCTHCTDCTRCTYCTHCTSCAYCTKQKGKMFMVLNVQLTQKEYVEWVKNLK